MPEAPKQGVPSARQELPPAYSPPMPTRLQEGIAATLMSNPNASLRQLGHRLLAAPLPSATMLTSPDPDDDPFEELSPINLRISTRVNVSRDNNLVALPSTPSDQASLVAEAIVRAFKSSTVMEGGIPMIDQDGRPRPVKIEVDAGMTVEGSHNIVGTESIIADVLRNRHATYLKQRTGSVSSTATAVDRSTGSGGCSEDSSRSATPSRRRSASEMDCEPQLPASKRARGQGQSAL
ncbi:hypothetical protein D7B24_000035 [Verticillium nonalfalfae]|nr:uncharacterized protein D7B24_000035 [Verticillium nonalfalfae]RNJ61183.1 hypothetical protein D7B24_000035 [Verticillium nonalfalfae]